jgi:hypothetical protein
MSGSSSDVSPATAMFTAAVVTGCDEPSGATLWSLTDTSVRGPGWRIRMRTIGSPKSSTGAASGSPSKTALSASSRD